MNWHELPDLRRYAGLGAVLILILLLLLSGCLSPGQSGPIGVKQPEDDRAELEMPEPSEPDGALIPASSTREATLVAVGDIMMHSPQITAAYNVTTATYSFDSYFEHLDGYLDGDWVIGNLETPMAGQESGYSGYPQFNAPEQLAKALKNAGFHIVSTANNHSLDRREAGVRQTIAFLEETGLHHTGTARSESESARTLMVTKNDIHAAFLSYTYGTNGIPIPAGKDYLVNLIDEERIKQDIRQARENGADLVSISLHFGHEYHRQPSDEQKQLSQSFIQAGADIILGSHPHVVQPYEWIEAEDADGHKRKGIVIYSLGNFISNQGPDQGTAKYTDVGVIFSVPVTKQFPEGRITLGEPETISTWVHKYYDNGKRKYRILPMEAVLESKDDALLQSFQYAMLEEYATEMSAHLQSLSEAAATLPNR
ncbi:CapA family protein [Xylanibacillus composti]|uniref:Capsule biosynthesis protein n=1 Tax=Xylanibacillus composti TaxID=1572762 RepID=A0A8J4H1C9_9BACL|nr:CapA family protein [Xylanibacillus composti]MDT9725537.1 CapA family protein [Xylanibacillus composti]GIQ67631.1 capsule biosynthesis protein [Xylanibacillus composti]